MHTVGAEHSLHDDGELRRDLARRQNEVVMASGDQPPVAADTRFPFLCECTDPFCGEYMKLTLDEYHSARREREFVTIPTHSRPGFVRRAAKDRRSEGDRVSGQ